MPDPDSLLFDAVAFAARAHLHQLRKDRETPYVSHVVRVCLVVQHVFGFSDPKMLMTALLHDSIEDTATDCDDIIEKFGTDVARWVAALTKDMRLPHEQREEAYLQVLREAEWQVKACKLADLYDNLADSQHLSSEARARFIAKSRSYLEAIRVGLSESAARAFQIVEARQSELESRIAS